MGSVEDAVERCDFVVDGAKEGAGYDNKTNFYEPMNKPAIFQGGEDRNGERSVADMIHNSRVGYDKAIGKTYVIQRNQLPTCQAWAGSCNSLIQKFGVNIMRFDVEFVRRWAKY